MPSNEAGREGRVAGRLRPALVAAAAALTASGCVRNHPAAVQDEREDIAVWDFPIELPRNTVHLWPPGRGSPARSKRHIDTQIGPQRLSATVAGDDPYFEWQLETPISAFGVHVEVEADEGGPLQLFFSTPRCPVFSEPCSVTISMERGRNAIEFLLDPHDPLRELRLDLPEQSGRRLVFDEITLLRSAELEQSWVPNQNVASTTAAPTGFFIDANAPDPWITALVAGLDPARITAAELVMRGPKGAAPQLYWSTGVGGYTEAASAHFEAVDAGELTHRAKLRGQPGWSGPIHSLRFDPGPDPGRYVVERIALVHDPRD